MLARTLAIAALLLLPAGSGAAPLTPAQKCAIGIDDAAGRFAHCRLEAAKAFTRTADAAKLDAALDRCESAFHRGFSAAREAGGNACLANDAPAEFVTLLSQCTERSAAAALGSSLTISCTPNNPSPGMVYCVPANNFEIDLYDDLLAAAQPYGITAQTELQVIAYGGNGGNGATAAGGSTGYGGDGGYANTITTIAAIAQSKGTTVLEWLSGSGGSHNSSAGSGGSGGSSTIIWMGPQAIGESVPPPSVTNALVVAGGGGGGTYADCCVNSPGHDGGHGGYVNGSGGSDDGNYPNYQVTQDGVTFWVGTGENGHGDGGNPGSPPSQPGVGGAQYHGGTGHSGGNGMGGNGGELHNSTSGSTVVGRPGWSDGTIDGESLLGSTGLGGDNDIGYSDGAGGGGYGGGGAGGGDHSGGGAGGGSFALANTKAGTDTRPERQGSNVVFLFVTN
ncbi:hypothetical protein K2Z84_19500 [Candidatus Binatia bacterium]|nr:hypothetical protein [Candidatus Binatia bacterium]